MASIPFPIFVISLKRSLNRRINISRQLKALELEYQFIDAVDGSQFTHYEVIEKYGEQVFYSNTYDHQRMSLGSLGCLLSHIKLYELMIENNIPVACVLEDDAELSPCFAEILNTAILQKVSWGTLLLGHYSRYRKSYNQGAEAVYWKKRVCHDYHIARAAEFPLTTIGYLIKLPTAKKLLNLAYPIRMPADWIVGNTELVGDILKIITPPCIVSNKDYRRESTIANNTEALEELQRNSSIPSLPRRLTVGLANIVLGSKEQRAAAAYDRNQKPSTYRPAEWQLAKNSITKQPLTSDTMNGNDCTPSQNSIHLGSKLGQKIHELIKYLRAHQARRLSMLSLIIKARWRMQRTLWYRISNTRSIKVFFNLISRSVLNLFMMFCIASFYLIQDINRTLYYGKQFSTFRIYIKKTGLFKYTRAI